MESETFVVAIEDLEDVRDDDRSGEAENAPAVAHAMVMVEAMVMAEPG